MLCLWECLTCGNSLEKQACNGRRAGGKGGVSLCSTLMGKNLQFAPSCGGGEQGAVFVMLQIWGPIEELQPFGTDSMDDCDLKEWDGKYANCVWTNLKG